MTTEVRLAQGHEVLPAAPLLLGGQHKVPTQTDQAEKETPLRIKPCHCFLSSEDGDQLARPKPSSKHLPYQGL